MFKKDDPMCFQQPYTTKKPLKTGVPGAEGTGRPLGNQMVFPALADSVPGPSEFQHLPAPRIESLPSFVLTAADAAALFRKSARTWRTWHAYGKVPAPVCIGRSQYWRLDELKAWVAAGCPDRETWESLRE
jgi:prophage regulatory protein